VVLLRVCLDQGLLACLHCWWFPLLGLNAAALAAGWVAGQACAA
jgi:hypothetical protein